MLLEHTVIQLLTDQGKTLSIAESCTGGLVSHRLTNVSGSSKALVMGLVAYNNLIKINMLKVPLTTLNQYGAVSQRVAIIMAQKIRKIGKSDFGIGITGIAGPKGGSKSKPIGLTYIAINTNNETLCVKCAFNGTRQQIKKQASTQALNLLQEFLI